MYLPLHEIPYQVQLGARRQRGQQAAEKIHCLGVALQAQGQWQRGSAVYSGLCRAAAAPHSRGRPSVEGHGSP